MSGDARPEADAWQEYVAAARRLDAVRVSAASAVDVQAQAVRAAREELTGIRARLAPQRSRLRALGIPERDLEPSTPEVAMAAHLMIGGPVAVLTALRVARATADAADRGADGGGRWGIRPAGWQPGSLPLLGYGLLALIILVALAGVGISALWLLFTQSAGSAP